MMESQSAGGREGTISQNRKSLFQLMLFITSYVPCIPILQFTDLRILGFTELCKSWSLPLRLLFSALLEAQEIFGLDFDPAELDQLAKEGLGSDEEEGEEGEEGEEEREEEVGGIPSTHCIAPVIVTLILSPLPVRE